MIKQAIYKSVNEKKIKEFNQQPIFSLREPIYSEQLNKEMKKDKPSN